MRGGVNRVERVGRWVRRPAGPHTPAVHRLLRHLRTRGFSMAPDVGSHDPAAGTELVGYLPGRVTGYPLGAAFRTDRALTSAARLLDRYHRASEDFEPSPSDHWYLPAREPAEVICHGDFAPYNCVLVDGMVAGLFDFDTAHPGPRLWDVGYAAYRWIPLTDPTNPDGFGDLAQQRRRLDSFCRAYGADDVAAVIDAAIARLQALIDTMRQKAEAGDSAFARHLEQGHDRRYLADIDHMTSHATRLAGNRRDAERSAEVTDRD